MIAEVVEFPKPFPKMRCVKCGVEASAACHCDAGYIPAREYAAQFKKDHPGMSNRDVAEKTGVSEATARRASGASKDAPDEQTIGRPNKNQEKVTGRDGKRYNAKTTRPKHSAPKRHAQADAVIDCANDMTYKGIAAETGVPERQCRHIVEEDRIAKETRLDTLAEVGALVDFSLMTAKQRLDAAIRAQKKLQENNYRMEFSEAINKQIDRIMPTLQQEKNDAFEREERYRQFLAQQKKIFTPDEYKTILRCLHPDSNPSAGIKAEAFRLFIARKFALTAET